MPNTNNHEHRFTDEPDCDDCGGRPGFDVSPVKCPIEKTVILLNHGEAETVLQALRSARGQEGRNTEILRRLIERVENLRI